MMMYSTGGQSQFNDNNSSNRKRAFTSDWKKGGVGISNTFPRNTL